VTIALVGLAGAAVDRLAGIYWYSDPITGTITGVESTSPPEAVSPLEAALRPILLSLVLSKTPSRTVAARALIQTLRNPGKLSFVLLPAIIVAAPTIVNAFGSGIGWEILLAVCFVGIPWFSGVAFGLNPLGDEGDVLPVTLTTTVSGRTFVRGLAILGFSVGSMLYFLQDSFLGCSVPSTRLISRQHCCWQLPSCGVLYCLHLQPEFGFPGLVQSPLVGLKTSSRRA